MSRKPLQRRPPPRGESERSDTMKLSDIPDVLADDFSDYSLKSRLDWLSSVGALVRFSYTEVDVSVGK